jgi:diguanylate cyclase (GGDEF)-like protein
MHLDLTTLLVANGLIVITAAAAFVLNTVFRQNDGAGRLWSVAFVAGILATFSYFVWGITPNDSWWVVAVGNGAFVLSISLMWCGARAYNGRKAALPVAVVLSVLTGAAVFVHGADDGAWAGAIEMLVALLAAGTLTAVECGRGRMRGVLSARVLVFVFVCFSAFSLVRLVVLVATGPGSEVFETFVGTRTSTLVDIALVVVAATSMSVLQSGRELREGEVGSSGFRIPGVLGPTLFAELAGDWLQRSRLVRDPLVLVLFEVDNLAHIHTAFGRSMGDRTVIAVGRTACTHCPPSTIVGRSEGHRFFILTSAPPFGSPQQIAERIQTALVESPLDPVEGIRATASWGIATTAAEGYDLAPLMLSAEAALADSRRAGSGTITLADTPA